MYSIEEIKEFIAVLEGSSLSVLEIQKEDGSKIHLEKPQQIVSTTVAPQAPVVVPTPAPVAVEAPAPTPVEAPVQEISRTINSPIVGVFYVAPSPDSEPYAPVGKNVKKGDTVCIVEAMKCMNEIQAEESGEIVEVLVKDGELVEYGQPLFRIR